MSARGIHQKDNMVDVRSTGGDGRLKGRIQGFCLVRTACYSPGSYLVFEYSKYSTG